MTNYSFKCRWAASSNGTKSCAKRPAALRQLPRARGGAQLAPQDLFWHREMVAT